MDRRVTIRVEMSEQDGNEPLRIRRSVKDSKISDDYNIANDKDDISNCNEGDGGCSGDNHRIRLTVLMI